MVGVTADFVSSTEVRGVVAVESDIVAVLGGYKTGRRFLEPVIMTSLISDAVFERLLGLFPVPGICCRFMDC